MIINLLKKCKVLFRGLLLVAFIAATYSYAMFQGGFVSWFLFYMTTCLIVVIIVYSVVPIGRVIVERNITGSRLVAGENIVVQLNLTRKFPFPFFYFVIEDVLSEEAQQKNSDVNSKVILHPSFSRKLTYFYHIRNIKRGEYQFSKVKIKTSDPFGLFRKEVSIKKEDLVIVYPNYQQLDDWKIYSENNIDAIISTNDLTKDMATVASSREYVPGDRLTSIDWKVTARVNKLMTKEFEDDLGQSFLIMLDSTMTDRTKIEEIEKAISLTASIIVQGSQQQIPIGLITLAQDVLKYPIQIGQAHQVLLIEHLAKLPLVASRKFGNTLSKEIHRIDKNTIVFIIQTNITTTTIESIKTLINKGVRLIYCYVSKKTVISEKQSKQLAIIKQSKANVFVVCGDNFKADFSGGEQHAKTV